MISVEASNVRISRKDIELFQHELGVRLPSDYVAFLEEYNGGYPESNILEFDNTGFMVQVFYGLKLEPMDDLRVRIEVLAGRIPAKCQAIAALEGGDALLMALDDQNYGKIYWWQHEIEQTRVRDMIPVAGSFTELMEKLQPLNIDEVDLSGYQIE